MSVSMGVGMGNICQPEDDWICVFKFKLCDSNSLEVKDLLSSVVKVTKLLCVKQTNRKELVSKFIKLKKKCRELLVLNCK